MAIVSYPQLTMSPHYSSECPQIVNKLHINPYTLCFNMCPFCETFHNFVENGIESMYFIHIKSIYTKERNYYARTRIDLRCKTCSEKKKC